MKHCDHTVKPSKLKLSISDSVQLLNTKHWDTLVDGHNLYLTTDYLRCLESTLHDAIDFRYIMFYSEEYVPVGVAVVQLLHFTNKDLNMDDIEHRFGHLISDKIISKLDARVMLCGNAFATGENGFLFCESIPSETAKVNLSLALNRIKRDEKKANNQVSLIMLKDFWPESFDGLGPLEHEDFSDFMIDVNMVVYIRENWKTYEDYLADLVTKFRTKVKSVYKKSASIVGRRFTTEDIHEHREEVERLYHNVLGKADYKFGELHAATFEAFSHNLPDNLIFMGYFLNDKMVGFSSSFKLKDAIDANFVGVDYDYTHDYSLYQRMLCDLVKLSIEHKVKELHFGRTAEQVKSCFGAVPVEMKLMVKHRNAITNKLVKPIIHQIKPSSFELRKPFKAALYE